MKALNVYSEAPSSISTSATPDPSLVFWGPIEKQNLEAPLYNKHSWSQLVMYCVQSTNQWLDFTLIENDVLDNSQKSQCWPSQKTFQKTNSHEGIHLVENFSCKIVSLCNVSGCMLHMVAFPCNKWTSQERVMVDLLKTAQKVSSCKISSGIHLVVTFHLDCLRKL